MRQLKYREAIDEATRQAMAADDRVFVFGVGVDDAKGIFGTTRGAFEQFGRGRVFDTPLSEAALTGVAVGAAISGMRPLLVHARKDFLMLTMDQIVNNAAKWHYMSGGTLRVPLTVRAIIGRGWGQAAQHSQSLQALFAHVPGLTVVMPAMPADAKGLLMSALTADRPVICLEHRWLYEKIGAVPEEPFTIPFGRAFVARAGRDVTIVAVSLMVWEALEAAKTLAAEGVEAEVIDLRTIRPLDTGAILGSVRQTGRLVVADTSWRSFGVSAEIVACVAEQALDRLHAPVVRVGLPDVPTPASPVLERAFYPGAAELVVAVRRVLASGQDRSDGRGVVGDPLATSRAQADFTGPF